MDPLASVEELRVFLDAPALDTAAAELFLALASGEVRAYAGQDFTVQTDDEVILDGNGTSVLLLPELPVLDVTLVEEGPGGAREALAGPDADSPVWEWSADGILRTRAGRWARRFRWYRVVYSHGFDPIPDEVKGVVLSVAGRAVENPGALRQETLGRYSFTAAGEASGVGLFAPERSTLDRGGFVIGSPRRPTSSAIGSGS